MRRPEPPTHHPPQILPQVDWDKGAALAHLLSSMGLDDPQQVYALYIGDDRTDEDAFRGGRAGVWGVGGCWSLARWIVEGWVG